MASRRFRVTYSTDRVYITKRGGDESLILDRQQISTGPPPENNFNGFDCYGILGIIQGNGESGDRDVLASVTRVESVGNIKKTEILRIKQVQLTYLDQPSETDVKSKQLSDLADLISKGEYYFSLDDSEAFHEDLTLSFLHMLRGDSSDRLHFWNQSMWAPFSHFDTQTKHRWLVQVISGYVGFKKIYAGSRQISIGVISRLANGRVGSRFLTRGIDDSGNVANSVESETILIENETISSHLQIRGSVPSFWEQPGINFGQHKCDIIRKTEGSISAARRHFKRIAQLYSNCHVVNLLGKGDGESKVSNEFEEIVNQLQDEEGLGTIGYTYHDYHKETPKGKNLSEALGAKLRLSNGLSQLQDYGFTHFTEEGFMSQQSGILRTNCLDCLDRTNAVQTLFALEALDLLLESFRIDANHTNKFKDALTRLWKESGNSISHLYAGTGALESGSALEDAKRSISRSIKNNTSDKDKQVLMDRLIYGNLPLTLQGQKNLALIGLQAVGLSNQICKNIFFRKDEICEDLNLRVSCCTWNVNGGSRSSRINDQLGEQLIGKWLLGKVRRARVIANFPADQPEDLELVEGDFIDVLGAVDDQWLKGKRSDGQIGIFPSNFVEDVENLYEASFDYNSDVAEDLSFSSGETITVTSKEKGEWWTGETKDGRTGDFPSVFVQPLDGRQKTPDIICVAFQEIVDLTADNIAKASTKNLEQWNSIIQGQLDESSEKYVHIRSEQLVGAAIGVWIKNVHLDYLSGVSFAKVKTGINAGVYTGGNKGAILVRLQIYNSTMAFICAHFAAHQKEIQQRNADMREIYAKARFAKNSPLFAHEWQFWLGDLNYRIDLDRNEAKQLIQDSQWDRLLEADQLIREKSADRVFQGWQEASISFAPTYKYDYGTDTYDSSEKARIPAWCDRVLWQRESDQSGANILDSGICVFYDRYEIKTSDHRPVVALIDVSVPKVNEELLEEVIAEEIQRQTLTSGDENYTYDKIDQDFNQMSTNHQTESEEQPIYEVPSELEHPSEPKTPEYNAPEWNDPFGTVQAASRPAEAPKPRGPPRPPPPRRPPPPKFDSSAPAAPSRPAPPKMQPAKPGPPPIPSSKGTLKRISANRAAPTAPAPPSSGPPGANMTLMPTILSPTQASPSFNTAPSPQFSKGPPIIPSRQGVPTIPSAPSQPAPPIGPPQTVPSRSATLPAGTGLPLPPGAQRDIPSSTIARPRPGRSPSRASITGGIANPVKIPVRTAPSAPPAPKPVATQAAQPPPQVTQPSQPMTQPPIGLNNNFILEPQRNPNIREDLKNILSSNGIKTSPMIGTGIVNPETDSFESENYSLPPSDENIYAMPPSFNRIAPPIPSNPPVTHQKIPPSDSFDAFFDSRATTGPNSVSVQPPPQNLSRVSSFSSTNSGSTVPDNNIGASIFGGAGQMGSNTRSTLPLTMGQQQPTYQMPPGATMGSQPLYPRLPIQQPQRHMQPMGMQPMGMQPMGQPQMTKQPMSQMRMNQPIGMHSLGAPRGQIVINSAAQLPSPMQPTKTASYAQTPKVQNTNLSDFDPFA